MKPGLKKTLFIQRRKWFSSYITKHHYFFYYYISRLLSLLLQLLLPLVNNHHGVPCTQRVLSAREWYSLEVTLHRSDSADFMYLFNKGNRGICPKTGPYSNSRPLLFFYSLWSPLEREPPLWSKEELKMQHNTLPQQNTYEKCKLNTLKFALYPLL